MGNLIYNSKSKELASLSNGATSVLYHVILLSGSKIAKNNWEKRFLIWIAERDQSVVGLGIVGFDVTKLEWTTKEFEQQKSFIMKTIQLSLDNNEWKNLPYNPSEEIIQTKLTETLDVFKSLKIEHISTQERMWYNKPDEFDLNEICEIHNIYLNKLHPEPKSRCQLCNFT